MTLIIRSLLVSLLETRETTLIAN